MANRSGRNSYLPSMLQLPWDPFGQQTADGDPQLEKEEGIQRAVDQRLQQELQMSVHRQLEPGLQKAWNLRQEEEIQMAADRQLEQELQMAVYRQLEENLQETREQVTQMAVSRQLEQELETAAYRQLEKELQTMRQMARDTSTRHEPAAGPSTCSTGPATTETQPVSEETISDTPTSTVSRVRALSDFLPSEPGKLQFRKGDTIFLLEHVSEEWWKGSLCGRVGIFPSNCVEMLPDPTQEELQLEAEMAAKIFTQMRDVKKLLTLLNASSSKPLTPRSLEEITNLYASTLPIRPALIDLIAKYTRRRELFTELHERLLQASRDYESLLEASMTQAQPNNSSTVAGGQRHSPESPSSVQQNIAQNGSSRSQPEWTPQWLQQRPNADLEHITDPFTDSQLMQLNENNAPVLPNPGKQTPTAQSSSPKASVGC